MLPRLETGTTLTVSAAVSCVDQTAFASAPACANFLHPQRVRRLPRRGLMPRRRHALAQVRLLCIATVDFVQQLRRSCLRLHDP